jgi:hypothetical protein
MISLAVFRLMINFIPWTIGRVTGFDTIVGTVNKSYHTQRWRRRAALQLKRYPLCAICLQAGQIVPATDADHIVPHKGNEWAFWYGKLQSLCGPCHRSVKQKEEKRGYRSDIGIDGWPTDPRHPANR